jgi:hypothetical protein
VACKVFDLTETGECATGSHSFDVGNMKLPETGTASLQTPLASHRYKLVRRHMESAVPALAFLVAKIVLTNALPHRCGDRGSQTLVRVTSLLYP